MENKNMTTEDYEKGVEEISDELEQKLAGLEKDQQEALNTKSDQDDARELEEARAKLSDKI